jgi:cbb3-type cytochrome oxidase subunit 3
MGLVREYLTSIAGVHIFAIISLMIFLLTFIFMVVHVYTLRKDEVRRFSRLPLEDEEDSQEDEKKD